MMKNIEKVSFKTKPKPHMKILKAIMTQNRDHIKEFNVRTGLQSADMQPLKLSNAEKIYMYSKFFNVVWTNKCRELYWCNPAFTTDFQITGKWMKFVVDNCDCSGVVSFKLDKLKFYPLYGLWVSDELAPEISRITKNLIKQFTSLKQVEIIIHQGDHICLLNFGNI